MGKAFKILPKNYLDDWGEFESWSAGTTSVPDGWIAATSPTCARDDSNKKYGEYGLSLVGGSNGGGVYRTIPDGDDLSGRTFKFGIWAKCATTGAYVKIDDGVANKTVHLDGLDAFYELTTPSMKLDYNATQIRVDLYAPEGETVYFDSGVLCEGEDLFTDFDTNIDIAQYQPSLTMKQDRYEVAQREGSFIPDNHLQNRNIRMSGMVVGTDVVSCRNHFDGLMKSILSWQTTEKRNLYLYDDRVAEVFLKKFDWNYLNGLKDIRFTMHMSLPDATTRSIGKYRATQVISGTITEFSLSYDGNAKELPLISLVADQGGAITTCQLECMTTGENFAYTGTVPTNVALDIDCNLGSVQNSSIDKIGDWSGDFIGLVRGTNYFRFAGSNCTINIDYYERFL